MKVRPNIGGFLSQIECRSPMVQGTRYFTQNQMVRQPNPAKGRKQVEMVAKKVRNK